MSNDIVILDVPEQETSKLETSNNLIIRRAEGLLIKTEADYRSAAEFLKDIKVNVKAVEGTFADMKEQAHKAHKTVCEKENSFKAPLLTAERIIKGKMQVYYAEQERIRREEEARIKEEQRKLADEQLKRAAALEAAGHVEQAKAAFQTASLIDNLNTVVEAPKLKAEGVSAQVDYDVRIIDEHAVPAYFMGAQIRAIDMAAIKRLAKATGGKVEIPGVAIFQTNTFRVRAN